MSAVPAPRLMLVAEERLGYSVAHSGIRAFCFYAEFRRITGRDVDAKKRREYDPERRRRTLRLLQSLA